MKRWSLKFGVLAVGLLFTTYFFYTIRNSFIYKYSNDLQSIIFLETTGKTSLTSRVACSIESTAHHHLNSEVVFHSVSPISRDNIYRNILENVPNIKFQSLNFDEVFEGTPLGPWHTSGAIRNSSFPEYHLSDAVRLAMLWKKGGIYLDSDMIVTHPFTNLTNALGYVFPGAGNNVLIFDQGHPFLFECMKEFAESYRGDVYAAQGPQLVTRVLEKFCGTNYFSPVVNKPEMCRGVTLLPFMTFFTHIWIDWRKLFLRPYVDYSKSYAVHLYTKLSQNTTGVPGDGSLLDLVAKEFCPLTYNLMVVDMVL